MEIICKKCGYDGVYFDGVVFICPDCNYEWTEKQETAEDKQKRLEENWNKKIKRGE